MLTVSPSVTRARSPRITEPYHRLTPTPRTTSPVTTTPGARYAPFTTRIVHPLPIATRGIEIRNPQSAIATHARCHLPVRPVRLGRNRGRRPAPRRRPARNARRRPGRDTARPVRRVPGPGPRPRASLRYRRGLLRLAEGRPTGGAPGVSEARTGALAGRQSSRCTPSLRGTRSGCARPPV